MNLRLIGALAVFLCHSNGLSQPLSLTRHAVDTDFAGMHCIKVFDMDGDGDLDIVGGSEWTPRSQSLGLAWWRNDGGDPILWTRFTVDRYFDHVMSVDVTFVDGDDYPDIIATSWNLHQIAWWKHSGDPTAGWSKQVVQSGFTNAHDARGTDVNGDGHTDIVGVSSGSAEVIVCMHDGSVTPGWSVQRLSTTFWGGKFVSVVDMDGDGDSDIVGTASDAARVTWWEHGGGSPIEWEAHTIASGFPGAGGLHVVDLNLDGRLDVIASSWQMDEVSYWICQDLATGQWQKNTLTTDLPVAVNVNGSDIDQDGDLDIVAIGKIPGALKVYTHHQESWTGHHLMGNFEGGTALAVEDLDEDGDPDIVAGASVLGDLYWWENEMTSSVPVGSEGGPDRFGLLQNYPNPFNPETVIAYSIGHPERVRLSILDTTGHEVAVLADANLSPGRYSHRWDGKDDSGRHMPGGVYFCRLRAGNHEERRKMVLMR